MIGSNFLLLHPFVLCLFFIRGEIANITLKTTTLKQVVKAHKHKHKHKTETAAQPIVEIFLRVHLGEALSLSLEGCVNE